MNKKEAKVGDYLAELMDLVYLLWRILYDETNVNCAQVRKIVDDAQNLLSKVERGMCKVK